METKVSTELGERFEAIKRHFKLNNSKLAIIAGCSSQAINDIVNGVTDNPKVGLIRSIAIELGLSIDWLLTGKGQMLKSDGSSPSESELSLNTDKATVEFFRLRIEEKDRMLFEKDMQLLEKDKQIARFRSSLGKRRGVHHSASLLGVA